MFRTYKFFMRGSRWCPLACVLVGSTATLLRAQEVEELSKEAVAAPQIVATQPAKAENPEGQLAPSTTSSFLRVESSSAGELKSLQTSVTRYRTAALGGAQVDLIGAVHIGEPEYYAELNTLFDTYDVLLVVDRNGEALKVLQKQIALGKKKIGIFYGAAHLPDFDKRLINDFGLQPAEGSDNPRWITAWDLSSTEKPGLSEPASLLLKLLKALE